MYGCNFQNFLLFTLFIITGGIILTSFASIVSSISFWIVKGDVISDLLCSAMINYATYPGTIFKNVIKIVLYTVIPVGIANYMPLEVILDFNIAKFICIIVFTLFITLLAFYIFNKGLKRYSSSNLMSSRI